MADTLSRKQKKKLKERAKKKKLPAPEDLPGASGTGDALSSSDNNHTTQPGGQPAISNSSSGVSSASTPHTNDAPASRGASPLTDCPADGNARTGESPKGDGSSFLGLPIDGIEGLVLTESRTDEEGTGKQEDSNILEVRQPRCNGATPLSTEVLSPPPPPVTGSEQAGSAGEAAVVVTSSTPQIDYVDYVDERQLSAVMELVDRDLSEPYSIFTYRYFLHTWPNLCVCAMAGDQLVGVIICKAETEPGTSGDEVCRGYIAMLAVNDKFRKLGIGAHLVELAAHRMLKLECDEVMLETEVTNTSALRLYERLGFTRDERLLKYYLNGVDAFRLRLWFH